MKNLTKLVHAGMPVLAVALLLLGAGNNARAINITVTNTADSGPGTLRQAIAASINGGMIDFDPSLNGKTITLTTQIGIARDITINGPGYNTLAINGNDQTRIFEITAGHTVAISGLRLRNGKAQGADGANNDYVCRYDTYPHQYPSAVDPTPGGDATGGLSTMPEL